ncbi:MAG: pyruvate, phosphate dikinase [Nitriliruptor sp.]|nr:MAG: pyruvate, phosphate dikinase [Nitriliruptor sp.]
MMTTESFVVPFSEGSADQKSLLGGKGANLAEMTRIGLPVPPGFIVTTDACRQYMAEGGSPEGLFDQVDEALAELEAQVGRKLGDPESPLLLSVRSGAVFSMPGMMDTVLNLGAMPHTAPGLAAMGDEWFAQDATRRFLEMFGRVVLGVDGELLEHNVDQANEAAGVASERDLSVEQLAEVVAKHRQTIADAGKELPEDPHDQLRLAIEAVFRSWDGDRAKAYRRIEGIPDDLGTAVNVQMMVFGNLGDRSATGVAFTRDPATGESVHYGDFLIGAQGEDVVAGTRAVEPLSALGDSFPHAQEELEETLDTLERHYRDMCDVEFTIENDKLWMLQTRVGKRSATAALRMAVEMVDEGLIDEVEALKRVTTKQLEALLHPRFGPDAPEPITTGLAASPGAAVGKVVLTSKEAKERGEAGESVVLVRPETSPEDLEGMVASAGMLTSRGGLVSHAAVVARGLGKPAVCGANELKIDAKAGTITVNGTVIHADDIISIDGTTGQVVVGEVELEVPDDDPNVAKLLIYADKQRTLHVWANADTPEDARRALEAGAEGIGLCRTEHQFLGDRLPLIRQMILSKTEEEELAALEPLEAQQKEDFEGVLEVMDGKTVVIRLLDPPLHEFLPDPLELRLKEASEGLDADEQKLLEAAEFYHEHNPMLGVRGIRLGILRPNVYAAQVRAIIGAAVARKQAGGDPRPEIMLPLTATSQELKWGIELIHNTAREVIDESGVDVHYTTATMIETPRAALRAKELAPQVDAFSFGTNDLTQLTFGFSRDDVEASYIPAALEQELLPVDPFRSLDPAGVGRLVEMAVTEGREAKPDLVTGICGEHGGDPDSIHLCHKVGMNHVSCSASRIEVARLAAAHAAMEVSGPASTA